MSPKRKLVIAGEHRQYIYWLRETGNDPKLCRYVFRPEDLRGVNYSDVELVFTGQYTNSAAWGSSELEWAQQQVAFARQQQKEAQKEIAGRQKIRLAKNRWATLLI